MKAHVIQIGNSQGIRIPKVLLQESGIKGEVALEICPEGILLRNISKPRSDWDKIFRSLHESDDDAPLSDIPAGTDFEAKEWHW